MAYMQIEPWTYSVSVIFYKKKVEKQYCAIEMSQSETLAV